MQKHSKNVLVQGDQFHNMNMSVPCRFTLKGENFQQNQTDRINKGTDVKPAKLRDDFWLFTSVKTGLTTRS